MTWLTKLLITILVTLLLLLSFYFSSTAHGATTTGWHRSITGYYHLIKATQWEVQDVWDSRTKGLGRRLQVYSFSDYKRKEIWYTTEASLRYEKWVVSSYRNLYEGWCFDRRQTERWSW